MAKLSNYKGSVDLISGLRPKNGGDFPLMEAHDIVVDESGTRLDEKLESMGDGGGTSITIDTTLTESGKAADAKVVGEQIKEISETIGNLDTLLKNI